MVKYSCELFVNGRSYGVRCMPPYRYSIKADELEAVNKLEIRVTNTAANQYVHTKSFEKYPNNKLGPYHATTLRFEEESQESGLYGPVRILI